MPVSVCFRASGNQPKKGRIVASSMKERIIWAMASIKSILHAADCNLSDLVQSNMYLPSMNPFIEFNN
ncbi:hypothetical protein E2P60_01410 [Candidatus Bathyarchaeota archaeon]|nr:hypothetical protein E2P60_01410 [Candidatus Bathyarchaeota archaeon]